MSSTVAVKQSRGVRVVGLLSIIAGIVFVIAGGITWWAVADQLSAEDITVSEDASFLAGRHVNDPFSAYAQAEVINKHALEMSDGMTYAELPRDDPRRDVVMNASFLRASLFTSVVAFGVAALVVGLGVLFILVGWALRRLADAGPQVAAATAGTAGTGTAGAHSYDDVPSAPAPRHQSPPAASTQTPGPTPRASTAGGVAAAAAAPATAHAATHAERPAPHAERAVPVTERAVPGTERPVVDAEHAATPAPITNPGPEPTTTPIPGETTPVTPTPTTPVTTPGTTPATAPEGVPDGVPDGVPQENPGNPPQTPETGTDERRTDNPRVDERRPDERPADERPADERPAGWESPADRVPPVDGTSGDTGTTETK